MTRETRRGISALLFSFCSVGFLPVVSGYVRTSDVTGTHNPIRTDSSAIQFYVNDKVAPGIVNRDGAPNITADSTPIAALKEVLATWNSISSASVKFSNLASTPLGQNSGDGKNVIVFADTDALRAAVGSANAVTVVLYSTGDYHILDSDILFNPAVLFSTTGAPGTTDLQSVATHELGHALGANHTNLYGATMFQAGYKIAQGSANGYTPRTLSTDEIAFATAVYPSKSALVGNISGTVSFSGGGPVRSALLTLVDAAAGTTMGGMTGPDGRYSLTVPVGSYQIYAEPFNKMIQPANLYVPASVPVDTAFKAAFYGGNTAPGAVSVSNGMSAIADIQVAAGATALSMDYLVFGGAGATGDLTSISTFNGGMIVASGQSIDLVMLGNGLNASFAYPDAVFRVLGPGVSVRPGSVRTDTSYTGQGILLLRATIDIAPRATPALASIFLSKGQDSFSLSGALTILPPKPVFTSQSVVNSASYAASAVSPGEIVSIYGSNLGPVTGWNNSDIGYDPATGGFPSALGGVTVTFDGVIAPIYYARADVLNVQVPFEVNGKPATSVVVSNNGLTSDPVTLQTAGSTPGLFTFNSSGKGLGIVANQDYSLNTAQNPAAKGSYVVAYLTGRGQAGYGVQTGKPAPAPPTLDAGGFTCTVGGVPAPVAFGGWTPTTVGLAQVNVMIPAGAPSGEQPIVVSVGGVSSQAGVTLFVK